MSVNLANIQRVSAEDLGRVRAGDSRHIHRKFFDRIFPNAPKKLRVKALELLVNHFFIRLDGSLGGLKGLPASIAFLSAEDRLLVTDESRLQDLPPALRRRFVPVVALESRSQRARFCVASDGTVTEFKGLTPKVYDHHKLNPNSNQPEGLLTLEAGFSEILGLRLVDAITSDLTPLEAFFSDLTPYAQLQRAGRPGQRFLPWLRMDVNIKVHELLAELEGLPLEVLLHKAGQGLGTQLRSLHNQDRTFHQPYRDGAAPANPFFSSFHSGNGVPHGWAVDYEGQVPTIMAEAMFWKHCLKSSAKQQAIPKDIWRIIEEQPFSLISRISDIHRFIAGGQLTYEPSVFEKLFVSGHNPAAFTGFLTGFAHGYFSIKKPGISSRVTAGIRAFVCQLEKRKITTFGFQQTYNIYQGILKASQ